MIHEEKDYISNAKSDPKWKLDDGETKTENEEEIATRFKNFFVNKIEGLKEKIVFTNIFHFLVYIVSSFSSHLAPCYLNSGETISSLVQSIFEPGWAQDGCL